MQRARRFWVLATCLITACLVAGSLVTGDDSKKLLDEREMKKLLRQSILGGDDAGLRETLQRLSRTPGRTAARSVLDVARALPPEDQKYYWILIESVAAFRTPMAYTELGEFIVQSRQHPMARDLMHALQKGQHKYLNRVVRRVLASAPMDLQLMAVDMSARLQFRRTVDILLPVYAREQAAEKDKPSELKLRILFALEALTLQRMGDSLANWQGWWEANRHKGLIVLRQEAEDHEGQTGLIQPLDPVRQRQFIELEKLAGKLLVIKGCTARNGVNTNFDHIENVLERLGLRPDVWEKTRLEDKDCPPLQRYAAVFINCTQINPFCQSPGHQGGENVGNRLRRCLGPNPHDEFLGKMRDPALQRIKAYVEGGGHLFTEDWVLVEVLEVLFGDYVGAGTKLSEGVVEIRASRGSTSHPLLRGVFVPPVKLEDYDFGLDEDDDFDGADTAGEDYDPTVEDDVADESQAGGLTGVDPDASEEAMELVDLEVEQIKHTWKIDNESPSIKVRSRKVTTLIVSPDLERLCGDPAVAVTFPVGRGVILHVLSHFGKQASARDEATIENVLVNFLLEVNIRTRSG